MTSLKTNPDETGPKMPSAVAEPDQAAIEAFGDRMIRMLSEGCSALLTSLGSQTGLFDALAESGPVTSVELAARASLDERYVREWLNGMTVAEVVRHEGGRYWLPTEHAAWLTTAAGPNNLAHTITIVPMLAEVEQDILACFREGGGLPYSRYTRFHTFMDGESRAITDAALVDGTLTLAPGLTERLRAGIDVADIGCGSGHAINVLARAFPASRLVGYDFSEEAIGRARVEAAAMGLSNARFEVRDVAELTDEDAFDLVTAFDAIHDQAHPGQVLDGIARALRPGGTFLMVDMKASSNVDENVAHPFAPALYTFSVFHCLSVSLGLGGDGLGTAWGRQLATSMLREAGFGDVVVHDVDEDPINEYYVCRR